MLLLKKTSIFSFNLGRFPAKNYLSHFRKKCYSALSIVDVLNLRSKSISPENNWCSFLYFLVFSKRILISLVYHTWSQVKLKTSPLWEMTYFHLFECIEIETADKNSRDRSEEWVCYLVILSHLQCQQVTIQFPGWVPPSAWRWIISFSKWPKATDQAQLG